MNIFVHRQQSARHDAGRNLYHWRPSKQLITNFFFERMAEADRAYDLNSKEQSDWYHSLVNYAQEIRWRLNKFKPGSEEYTDAIQQVAAWYAVENMMDRDIYGSGKLVRAMTNWFGYPVTKPWKDFEPTLLDKCEPRDLVKFEAGCTGMVVGEKLVVRAPLLGENMVRFQKVVLVTLNFAGGYIHGCGPDADPINPPKAQREPTQTRTLLCYFNPMKRRGRFPFVEWKRT